MKHAVDQIKQLIQYHENQRDEHLRFVNSDRYRNNTTGEIQLAIDHTHRIYAELIDELETVIRMIEEANESDVDPEQARRHERIRQARRRIMES